MFVTKTRLGLEDAESDRLVNRQAGTDTHPDGVEGTNQEDSGGNRTTERVLELVDRLEERHRDQTRRDGGHGKDTEELVRNDTKRVERREEVPLRENFKRGGERVRRFTERGRFHHREADAARDGAENDDRENVKQIIRPRRFTVVVVAHTLGELGAEHRVGEVRLLGDGRDDLEVTPSLRGDAARDEKQRSVHSGWW